MCILLALALAQLYVMNRFLGISFKTQALYVAVFVSRYLDLFWEWVSLYNFVMKIFFIASSCYILYLMKYKYRCASPASPSPFHISFTPLS